MKNALYATLLFSLSYISPSFASEPVENDQFGHGEQGIGFGTGSIVGGVIAGPPGIIAGALIGSLIGQNIVDENQKVYLKNTNTELKSKLLKKNSQIQTLKEDSSQKTLVLRDTHLTIERLIQENQQLKNHALNFDVQFRTNSINIEKQYQKYLVDLANALNTTPNVEVEVAGFADRSGDEEYNLELSIQRAKNVKEYLVSQGIEKDRITMLAYGETQPLHPEENLENNFFDRRVSIYLRPIEISTENIAEEITKTEESQEIVSKL